MARLRISANLNALLDTIAWAEGTSTSPITKDDGYDIIVTGIDGMERFDNYAYHPFSLGRPSKIINTKGLKSNASGRYQFMLRDYQHYKAMLGLRDFGPLSQDVWAIQLIRERRVLPLIEDGHIKESLHLISNLWASIAGAGYGQHEHSLDDLVSVYLSKGGKLWDSKQSLELELPQSSPLSVPFSEEVLLPETKPKQTTLSKMLNGLAKLMQKLLPRK